MSLTSDALEGWDRHCLPAFVDRMRGRIKDHCEEGHRGWPPVAPRCGISATQPVAMETSTADILTISRRLPSASPAQRVTRLARRPASASGSGKPGNEGKMSSTPPSNLVLVAIGLVFYPV